MSPTVLSQAMADLMVATLVMPVSLQTDVYDMWMTFDVFCCGVSILHFVAISVNLYWAVINKDLVRNRSAKHILSSGLLGSLFR